MTHKLISTIWDCNVKDCDDSCIYYVYETWISNIIDVTDIIYYYYIEEYIDDNKL